MIRPFYQLAIVISLASRASAADASPDALLLDRIGQHVKQAWDDLTAVACTEKLTQEKLNELWRLYGTLDGFAGKNHYH